MVAINSNFSAARYDLNLRGKKVLVTGATGFLGSHLCQTLAALSNDVHGISREPQTSSVGLRWWHADLCDLGLTRSLINEIRPDVIFHLTTHGWGALGLDHVQPSLYSDVVATVNLLTAATEVKIRRLVLTGSSEEPPAGKPEFVPVSPYATAKWVCSAYARMFHGLYQTPAVIVRVFMTYGPRQPTRKLIPYTILSLLDGRRPEVLNGERLIDWVYVDDVIAGIISAGQAPDVEGSTIDVGSGTLVSIREVVGQLVSLIKPDLHPLYGSTPSTPVGVVRAANVIESFQRIGWKPARSLAEGLELTIEWYRAKLNENACASQTETAAHERNQPETNDSPESRSRS